MMKKLLLFSFLTIAFGATAQTTAIPDPAFEQRLISLNIDSDGVVNGQVLTSDVANITELTIQGTPSMTDLTGIEDFTSLETLTVTSTSITELNVSSNTQLRALICPNNMLSTLNVSSNTLLETLLAGNAADLFPKNEIVEIDLSNSPNIKTIDASLIPELTKINLKNGNNNEDMAINVSMWTGMGAVDPDIVSNTVCIEIDNEEAAQNGQFPYSEWEITDWEAAHIFSENCALGTTSFTSNNLISIYPNPTSDLLFFSTTNSPVEKAIVFDISGRKVKEFAVVSNSQISLAGLSKGVYMMHMFLGNTIQSAKVVVE